MDGVSNVFFIDINFIKYYITQTKLFKVKVKKIRLKKSKLDNYFGTEVVLFIKKLFKKSFFYYSYSLLTQGNIYSDQHVHCDWSYVYFIAICILLYFYRYPHFDSLS